MKCENCKILSKNVGHLQKDINRIRKMATSYQRMNCLRKIQVTLYTEFIDKLKSEGRIDAKELKPFMPNRKETEASLLK